MSKECTSSSGEEDGDATWRAAIDSVAAPQKISLKNATAAEEPKPEPDDERDTWPNSEPRPPKIYQLREGRETPLIRPRPPKINQLGAFYCRGVISYLRRHEAQKLIDEFLDRRLEMVTDHKPDRRENDEMIDGGVRLFSKSTRGIVYDPIDRQLQSRQRPRIIPGEQVDEKSKKFKRRVRSASVDGEVIIASATCARDKALKKSELRDAVRKAGMVLEEERIAKLKKQRGEKWLPSLARQMQAQSGGVKSRSKS